MPDALTAGAELDSRWTLVRRLHAGAMGEVWRVRDRSRVQDVVAKILPAAAPAEQLEQLRREWSHTRRMDHPNVVSVFDFHEGNPCSFFTMLHAGDADLGRFRGQRPAEILRLALPLADALQHVHSRGVVHRDVKVGNVLLDAAGQPRLIDFGIAARSGTADPRCSPGGSPYSVGPQQLAGEVARPADDIYAFGVLLYELIDGHPPFWPEITPVRVREEPPAALRSPHPVDPALADLIARLLAKSGEGRPRDMAAVKAELELLARRGAGKPGRPERLGGESMVRLTPPPRVKSVRPLSHRPAAVRKTAIDRRQQTLKWLTVVLIAALTAMAAAVFFVLPQWTRKLDRTPQDVMVPAAADAAVREQPTSEAQGAGPPEPTAGEVGRLKQRVAELRHRATALVEELTAKQAAQWNRAAFVAATDDLASGEEHLQQGRYVEAEAAYVAALRQLESLDAESLRVLERALSDGRQDLEAADPVRAAAAFGLALKIAPQNRAARSGRERAESLPEVIALLDSGERSERAGRLERASERYQEAVTLDPLFQPAREALSRVRRGIADDGFSREMSAGLSALHGGDFAAAREAFARADALRSGSPQVADALARVDEAQKLRQISTYREEALELEAAERWQSAAERYAAVLELDPTIRFAQEGQRRSRTWAGLSARLTFQLDHPERLSSEQVFDEASNLLTEARQVASAGPRHLQQVQRLEALLATAGAPIRVYLESDNLTEITVYQVGRLGTFTRRELELRPGTYTVVGSRRGYRDVRRQLVVHKNAAPEPLLVRCEEKI